MYSLKVYVLNNCYYCNQTKLLLKNNSIKAKIITVKEDQKDKYKSKDINTFPMIYLVKKNKKILIGGYDKLTLIINQINNKSLTKQISYIKKELPTWKKKDILRLLSILN